MTDISLTALEANAVRGADLLDDDQLAAALANRIDAVIIDGDEDSRVQDLAGLAAACLITARRMDARRQR